MYRFYCASFLVLWGLFSPATYVLHKLLRFNCVYKVWVFKEGGKGNIHELGLVLCFKICLWIWNSPTWKRLRGRIISFFLLCNFLTWIFKYKIIVIKRKKFWEKNHLSLPLSRSQLFFFVSNESTTCLLHLPVLLLHSYF